MIMFYDFIENLFIISIYDQNFLLLLSNTDYNLKVLIVQNDNCCKSLFSLLDGQKIIRIINLDLIYKVKYVVFE